MICTAAGAVFSSALERRCAQLQSISALIDEMSVKIRYRSVRLPELVREISEESAYSGCSFVEILSENIEGGMRINDAWSDSAERASFLSESDRDILKNMSGQLGNSDTDGQLALFASCGSLLMRSINEAESERDRKAKTIFGVWTLCGIGVGIILI